MFGGQVVVPSTLRMRVRVYYIETCRLQSRLEGAR